MVRPALALLMTLAIPLAAGPLEERARLMLQEMIRLAAVNPPGGETRVARYLEGVARKHGIECEVIGGDRDRMNFIARVRGNGAKRPLLLMAHSDVVPADPKLWTVPPFSGELKDGFIYGRGAVDTLGLLAAEMSVLIDLKERGAALSRDVIVLAEADEEAGSTGIRWLVDNSYSKIDAEFALNEGGGCERHPSGEMVFGIQTSEKIPTRVMLTAQGRAGHASVPRSDNAVVHLARAVVKLAEAEQPVRLTTTTRRYLAELSKLPKYDWLRPLLPQLEDPALSTAAAVEVRRREPELAPILQTAVSPTMLEAGVKVNVIPNAAVAHVDVRRLPGETKEEIYERFRRIIDDPSIAIEPDPGQDMPPTEPSSLTTELYRAMEKTFRDAETKAVVIPFMSMGATDGSFLRAKGMAVYGVPVFERIRGQALAHGNDERIAVDNLDRGTRWLRQLVNQVAQ